MDNHGSNKHFSFVLDILQVINSVEKKCEIMNRKRYFEVED